MSECEHATGKIVYLLGDRAVYECSACGASVMAKADTTSWKAGRLIPLDPPTPPS
jgi:hypothetical protein